MGSLQDFINLGSLKMGGGVLLLAMHLGLCFPITTNSDYTMANYMTPDSSTIHDPNVPNVHDPNSNDDPSFHDAHDPTVLHDPIRVLHDPVLRDDPVVLHKPMSLQAQVL